MCSEMGISYSDMLGLTWKEYNYYVRGYARKLERGWDYSRHLMSCMFNSSGFSKQKVKPTDILKLEVLDFVRPTVKKKVDFERILRR